MKITYTLNEVLEILEHHSLEAYDTFNILSTAKAKIVIRDEPFCYEFEIQMAGPYEKAPE